MLEEGTGTGLNAAPDASRDSAARPEAADGIRRVGKGVFEANLKLAEVLERLERIEGLGAPPSGGGGSGDDFALLADVVDGLDRALDAAGGSPAPERAGFLGRLFCRAAPAPGPLPGLIEGVSLTRTRVLDALARKGYEPVDCSGPFDPLRHQALSTEPGDPGRILRVVRRGWTLRDGIETRVVRQPLVVVGKIPVEREIP